MTTINPYLSFNGTCEAAFNFYKSVFGGEFEDFGRYKNIPSEQPIPDSEKEKIMHISLPINEEVTLMGSDSSEFFGQDTKIGNNISLCISPGIEKNAYRIFEALSEEGTIITPIEKAFWGALFGILTDKFGVCWMVNHCYPREK